jgi:predicted metal-dependent peptidase
MGQVNFSNPRDKLAAARLLACERFKYFRRAILAMVPKEAPGLGTFATSREGVMLWDPERVKEWTTEQLAAVVVHEVSHLLRKHADRCDRIGAQPAGFNIAGDAEINDDLQAAGLALPGDPVLPTKLGAPDGLTAEEYYRHMERQGQKSGKEQQKGDKGDEGQEGQGGGDGEEQEGQGEGGGKPDTQHAGGKASGGKGKGKGHGHVGAGHCGGCAGNPTEDEKEHAKGVTGRSERELESVRRTVAEEIRKAAEKGQGTVPAGWRRWADAQLKPPKIPWQQKLARAVRGGVAYRPGAVDLTHSRISRRQAGVGFGPGRPVLHASYAPQPRVAVVVDTSGSMGDAELSRAIAECRGVLAATGAKVEFCACDAAVHELKPIVKWQDAVKLLKGGGGTNFCPALEALEKKHPRPDVVVFITDGMGPAPATSPPFRVIWTLVGPHKTRPCTWGEMVEVEENSDQEHS